MKKLAPSTIFILALVLGAAALAGAAAFIYRGEANKEAVLHEPDETEVSGMLVQELRAMYSDVPPAISQFAAVAERNLFSPERKAWAPPPPEPDQAASKEEDPPPPSGPQRIRLYGTTISPERKTALLYFENFSSRQKHRVVQVGESVEDDGERARGGRFTLMDLEQDKAVLADARGQEIVVGLYDHERTAPPPPSAPKPEVKPAQPVAAAAQPASPPAVQPQGEPIRRMEDIPQSLEEREELARQGRLRRISTPFGPAFRPVE